jgi:hypothetical protein
VNDDHALANAILAHAAAISTLAESIDHLAAASQALRLPGPAKGPPSGGVSSPSPTYPGTPAGGGPPPADPEEEIRIKMSKKVYWACKNNNWDIAAVGQQILERPVGADSRKWSKADLSHVLDYMKDEWNVG